MTQISDSDSSLADDQDGPVLDVKGLTTHFFTRDGVVHAVDDVSFSVNQGEVLGLVGESGCGKSVTSLSIMGLIPHPGRIVAGQVLFRGRDLTALKPAELREIRGDQISMIFQQPTSSLNPVYRVGAQISEVFQLHRDIEKKAGEKKATEMLAKVGIPDPGRRSLSYPHEMSGGMAQRVMIAMALALEPQLLIADEPTTALDVTIQAQILDLMRDLKRDFNAAVLLITHDLGVVAEMADRVAVMYAGQVVEEADVRSIFSEPKHPYTQGLIGSIPVLGMIKDKLDTIPGVVPNLIDPPDGCRFAARCRPRVEHGLTACTEQNPELLQIGEKHTVRCFLYEDSQLRAQSPDSVDIEQGDQP